MLEPITAKVTKTYAYTGAEEITFSNGHVIYFSPSDLHSHGHCSKHNRNCLATFTFAERWALQHSDDSE